MRLALIAAAALALSPLAAGAQSAADAIKARQGYFSLLNVNMAPLAAMAKGDIAYDADVATLHAANLAALAQVNIVGLFPQGTDSDARFGETAALPAIWADMADVGAKFQGLATAVAAMQGAAGAGRAELGGAVQQVGVACKACHDSYRSKE